MNPIADYLNTLQTIYRTGDAREHSYRAAFSTLIENLRDDITVINEPSYTDGNAPDFLFKKGDIRIAYAECKDIDKDINDKKTQQQAKRYVTAFGKILLTNYLDFQIIDDSGLIAEFSIGSLEKNIVSSGTQSFETAANLIKDYIQSTPSSIRSAKKLASIMAAKSRILRDVAIAALAENNKSEIYNQYKTFQQILIHDLKTTDFADMYAQTIVYGLFVARYYDPTPENFSRDEAHKLLPSTNPLLKKFFLHVSASDYDSKVAWLIDELIDTYLATDVASLMHKEFVKKQKDPVLHFYETFLGEYDSKLRKSRGVYYTPEPIVSFIVRGVDEILKTKFNISDGLASTETISHEFKLPQSDGRTKDGIKKIKTDIHRVQILDPAVGTGTFLNEIIHEIHKSFTGQEGLWPGYVKTHLLPRLHGFELMMASYTMAHLKLGITLAELGYEGRDRLSVWLTNSLEESIHEIPDLFMSQWLTEESNQASKIKSETPVMVVIGNPPYSGESFNKNYSGHDVYKVEPGGQQKLQEKNSKWINDDYVKFIRFAEDQINRSGEGVFGYITPHGFLDNPTFRGMRWHLMETFDELYILDLHGNANKKEVSPDGSKDENVFSIKTGTSIIFGLKLREPKTEKCQIFHSDLYGKQNSKYETLAELSFGSWGWKKINPQGKELFFIPFDYGLKEEYEKGFSVNKAFPINTVGIVTSRDGFVIDESKEILEKRIQDFLQISPEEAETKYSLRENKKWKIAAAQNETYNPDAIKEISYRPFDNRYIYFDNDFIERSRSEVMQHFIRKGNTGLTFCKQFKAGETFQHCFITEMIMESSYVSNKTGEITYTGPLYLYSENGDKIPNLDPEIWASINAIVGDTTPEQILDYIYAVLHAPSYREKYQEFLKIDFPRVPYPKDKQNFDALGDLGTELRNLHLMKSVSKSDLITSYPETGDNIVAKGYPKFIPKAAGSDMNKNATVSPDNAEFGNVFINDFQYFENVPVISWNFYIGGYQPAQKWLKDRRGRELSMDDLLHYQKIIYVLFETDKTMKQIDEIIKI